MLKKFKDDVYCQRKNVHRNFTFIDIFLQKSLILAKEPVEKINISFTRSAEMLEADSHRASHCAPAQKGDFATYRHHDWRK